MDSWVYVKYVGGLVYKKPLTIDGWISKTPGARDVLVSSKFFLDLRDDDKKHSLLKACICRKLSAGDIPGISKEDSDKLLSFVENGTSERPNKLGYDVYYRVTTRGCAKTLAKLGSAWFTYCYLRSYINRKLETPYAGLGLFYSRGILGTVRTGPKVARELGISHGTFYSHVDKLVRSEVIHVFPYHCKKWDKPVNYYTFGTWNIVNRSVVENFFIDSIPHDSKNEQDEEQEDDF